MNYIGVTITLNGVPYSNTELLLLREDEIVL